MDQKVSLYAYAPRDSPPSHTLLDQTLDPRVSNCLLAQGLKSIALTSGGQFTEKWLKTTQSSGHNFQFLSFVKLNKPYRASIPTHIGSNFGHQNLFMDQ